MNPQRRAKIVATIGPATDTEESLEALLAAEVDPRERRQLDIVRTERAIFERCLQKLKEEPAVAVPVEQDHAELLAVSSSTVLKSSSTKQLLQTARKLAEACASTALESNTLSDRLSSAVEEIARRMSRDEIIRELRDKLQREPTEGEVDERTVVFLARERWAEQAGLWHLDLGPAAPGRYRLEFHQDGELYSGEAAVTSGATSTCHLSLAADEH